MRVVVTGASGFLGHNALLRAPRTWDIVAVSHQTPGLDRFVADQGLSHVRTFRGDLRNADAVARLSATVGGRADAVLYLAANGDPAVSSERPRFDLEANVTALVSFLEGCAADHVV
jgi:nucleoside-diphosphate-sugar epimerase